MRALKGLVTGLGLMIVIIMSVIAYGLYKKSSDPDFKFFSLGGETARPTAPVPTPTAGLKGFGQVMVSLPDGCSITGVTGEGPRLFLKIGPAGPTCERIVVLDAVTGAILGDIKATP